MGSHEDFAIYSHIYIWPETNLTKLQKIISRSDFTVEKKIKKGLESEKLAFFEIKCKKFLRPKNVFKKLKKIYFSIFFSFFSKTERSYI